MPPIRTKAQKAQSAANLTRLRLPSRGSEKENEDGITSSPMPFFTQHQIDALKARGDTFQQKAHNEGRRRVRAQASAAGLREELDRSNCVRLSGLGVESELRISVSELESELDITHGQLDITRGQLVKAQDRLAVLARKNNALRMQKERASARKSTTVSGGVEKSPARTLQIKEPGGLISLPYRTMVRDLVSNGKVTEGNIDAVVKRVAGALGVNVVGTISRRSSARMVAEGGIAAKIQVVHELQQTDRMFFLSI
jgi:hypothetical protein